MKFSAIFRPVSLFSLKDSTATNTGAKTLLLPSPYSVKMAFLNQAIILGDELKRLSAPNSMFFSTVRDANISYNLIEGVEFCVNNTFIKILKGKENKAGKTKNPDFVPGLDSTVSFREYLQINGDIEMIIEVRNELEANYWKKYLHTINYFGKRGCFFQFIGYKETLEEANVTEFKSGKSLSGTLQQYDDFAPDATFEQVSNFSSTGAKRVSKIWLLPMSIRHSSKAFTNYRVHDNK